MKLKLFLCLFFLSTLTFLPVYSLASSKLPVKCLHYFESLIDKYHVYREKLVDAVDFRRYQWQRSLEAPEAHGLASRALRRQAERQRRFYRLRASINPDELKPLPQFDARVKPVIDPQEGFLAKLLLIDQAKYTIDISTYIFKRDKISYTLLNALKRAITRGVRVRILIDSIGSIHPFHAELKALHQHAKEHGGYILDPATGLKTNERVHVETVVFNAMNYITKEVRNFLRDTYNLMVSQEDRIPLIPKGPTHRNHSKIVAIDIDHPELAVSITGGRNISEDYYGIPAMTDRTFNDMEYLVRNRPGAAAEQNTGLAIADLYNKVFYHLGNKWLSRTVAGVLINNYRIHLRRMEKAEQKILPEDSALRAKLEDMRRSGYLENGFDDAKATLLHTADNVMRSFKDENISDELSLDLSRNPHVYPHLLELFKKAKKKLVVVTPYPNFTAEELEIILDWLGGDPERQLIVFTNSVMSGDNILAQIFVDSGVGEALKNQSQAKVYNYGKLDAKVLGGTEVYGKVHAKYYISDSQTVIVGSYNGDRVSQTRNVENMWKLEQTPNAPTLNELKNMTAIWISDSYLYGSEEANAVKHHPKLPLMKRIAVKYEDLIRTAIIKLGLDKFI